MTQNEFYELAERIIAVFKTWQEAKQIVVSQLRDANRRITDILEQGASGLEVLRLIAREAAPAILAALEAYPSQIQTEMRTCAEHHWYFDPIDHEPYSAAANLFQEGQHAEANDLLIRHIENVRHEIQDQLNERFPRRSPILADAFDAHTAEKFSLSVPVFLIQADGICFDLTREQLYSRRGRIPKLAEALLYEEISSFDLALLAPLIESMPLTHQPNQRIDNAGLLYRHAILHGESCDYASRRNSCQAISLLGYVGWIIDHWRRGKDDQKSE